MANRRLLGLSNHIAAPAAAAASVVATLTGSNRHARQLHHHVHLAKAKTLFISLALVSCLISINCASFGRHEWRKQPKYSLYPPADDSSATDEAGADSSRQLEAFLDQLGANGGNSEQQQPAQEASFPNDNFHLVNYLLSSPLSGWRIGPPPNSHSAGEPIKFVGLPDDLAASEFGYVQSDPADYQANRARLLPAIDLRDAASFGNADDNFQSFTDPRENLLSLSTQPLDQAGILPSGADKIPAYTVGEGSHSTANSATKGDQVAHYSSKSYDDKPLTGGDNGDDSAATAAQGSTSGEHPARKLTTLLEEDEAAEEAAQSGADKKDPSPDKNLPGSNNQSEAGGAKQALTSAANKTDLSEHQQQLLSRVVSLWKHNASSKAVEQSGSPQQQPTTGSSQGNSGGLLSSLYNGIVRCISFLTGDGGSSSGHSHSRSRSSNSSDDQQRQPMVIVKEHRTEQDRTESRATGASNQDKNGDDGDKSTNRATTKLSVSTPIEPDATTKTESSSAALAGGGSIGASSSGNSQTPMQADDKQQQIMNTDNNAHAIKQPTSEESNGDDQESSASSSSSSSAAANVELSPVGTFMASELDSAKVVGSSDDVQIASDDKQHNLIMTTSSIGDANNKRNIFHLTTSGLQHHQQQHPSTIGEHKVSLLRHSSLILPLGSNDELVVSTSPQQSSSLLGRYISSPSGSDGADMVFNLQNSQSSKHQSAATTEAGGLSLDDEYTQMSHRSYSRRLHPDGEVYGQFAGLRPSPQGSNSFARALPIVGGGIRDDQGGAFGNAMGFVQKTNDAYFLVMVAAFCVMAMAVVLATGLFAYRVQQQRKSTSDSDYPTYGVVGPNNMNGKCGGAAAFVGGYFASNLNNHHANGSGGPGSTTGGSSLSISGKHLADLYSVSGDSGIVSGVHHNKNQHIHSGTRICGGADCVNVGSAKRANLDCNSSGGQGASGATGNQHSTGNNNFMANQNAARMYHYQHQKQQMIISDRASTGRHTSASDLDSEDENDDGSYTVYECPGLASAHEMEIKNPLFNDDRSP